MPIQSRWSVPVPQVSLHKWVFGSSFGPLPDRKIFFDADHPTTKYLTLDDFRLLSKRVALGLQTAGLRPGDRVLLCSGNSLEFPALFMGVLMAGGVFTGASPALQPLELAHQLRDSDPTFVLATAGTLKAVGEACALVGFPNNHLFFVGDSKPSSQHGMKAKNWSTLIATASEAELFDWVEPQDPQSTPCCLNYSSGTTGKPKGVEITHFAYVANGEANLFLKNQETASKSKVVADSSVCFMPMYHAAGQTTFIVNNPRMGMSTYIMPSYDFGKLLNHIERFQVTSLMTAPPILLSIANNPITAEHDLSTIREVICGTAPLASEVADKVEKMLWPNGEVYISQGWGMTEITCTGSLRGPDDSRKSSSVGEVVPNACFKIVADGKEVTEPHKSGELWFAGPTVMKGYWRNPTATADTIHEENGTRWVKTGDVVYVDKYGPGARIHIVDRIKDLIKVRGFQVSPVELEGVLLDHKGVADAAVVGVVVAGEEFPRAYVVRNSKISEKEIIEWINGRVAKYKQLRGGLCFVDSIPRLPTGKILRRDLRRRAQEEVSGMKANL